MPVITRPSEFNADDVFVDLEPMLGHRLYLKCEGFNFAGSIKLKAAAAMIKAAEEAGQLRPGSVLVESSSGNLGVALAMIAANRGYRFTCVTDDRCNLATRRMIQALGGHVKVITEPADEGGLLGARIAYVEALCAADERLVWLDQYRNAANWQAHSRTTGPEILREFPDLDVLFVGAGTTGTLMGCARFLRDWSPRVQIVAVDAVGSMIFGGPPCPRNIPGLGSGVRPPMLDTAYVDDVVLVSEPDTMRACRQLGLRGFLFGGSTGTVVAGAEHWLTEHGDSSTTAVGIAPDLAGGYLDTIYDDDWVTDQVKEPQPPPRGPAPSDGRGAFVPGGHHEGHADPSVPAPHKPLTRQFLRQVLTGCVPIDGRARAGAFTGSADERAVRCHSHEDDPMSDLTDDEADAVAGWLDRHEFEKVSSRGGDSSPFGDRQAVWARDGTLVRLTRDRGQWWYDVSQYGASVWLDVDAVAGALGSKSTAPVDRVADVTGSIDDRVFGALSASIRHSP